jgi:hypothetical protein
MASATCTSFNTTCTVSATGSSDPDTAAVTEFGPTCTSWGGRHCRHRHHVDGRPVARVQRSGHLHGDAEGAGQVGSGQRARHAVGDNRC